MRVKLLLRSLLAASLTLLSVASVNYMVDPALVLRDGEYERVLAGGILAGSNAVLSENMNERSFQRYLINGLETTPDSVILGSSRALLIPSESFGAGFVLNNGVSGAVIEDMIGIFSLYDGRGMLPDTVFLVVDPWLFNDSHMDTRYLELLPEYNAAADKLRLRPIPATVQTKGWYVKLEQAVSPTYFQASVKNIHSRPPAPVLIDGMDDAYNMKLSDGGVVYPAAYRNRTESEVVTDVKATINGDYIYHSTNYETLSPVVLTQFMGLFNYLEDSGVNVVYILPPLHPLLYEYACESGEYGVFLEAEAFVLDFASQRGIPALGSFDPAKVGASGGDFYDAYHPKREFMAQLCQSLS